MSMDFTAASSQYLVSTDKNLGIVDRPFWMSCWFMHDGSSNGGFLAGFGPSGANQYANLAVSTGELVFMKTRDGATDQSLIVTTITTVANTWYNAIGQWTSATSRQLWVDAKDTASSAVSIAIANKDQVAIGVRAGSIKASFWDGKIAEVIFGRGIIGESDRKLLAAGYEPTYLSADTEVIGYWPLWAEGTELIDATGRQQNLTSSGGPAWDRLHPTIQRRRGGPMTLASPAGGGSPLFMDTYRRRRIA